MYYQCNQVYDDELNQRINQRNVPTTPLQPLFDLRPVQTKYTWFQTVEERARPHEPLHTPSTVPEVSPGQQRGEVHVYLQKVDTESKLRNQTVALQRASQAVYVPETNSSLYEWYLPSFHPIQTVQPYQEMQPRTAPTHLAPNLFQNTTRTNLRV
jgi:hypothetical protein